MRWSMAPSPRTPTSRSPSGSYVAADDLAVGNRRPTGEPWTGVRIHLSVRATLGHPSYRGRTHGRARCRRWRSGRARKAGESWVASVKGLDAAVRVGCASRTRDGNGGIRGRRRWAVGRPVPCVRRLFIPIWIRRGTRAEHPLHDYCNKCTGESEVRWDPSRRYHVRRCERTRSRALCCWACKLIIMHGWAAPSYRSGAQTCTRSAASRHHEPGGGGCSFHQDHPPQLSGRILSGRQGRYAGYRPGVRPDDARTRFSSSRGTLYIM